jgi:hypothetical protein
MSDNQLQPDDNFDDIPIIHENIYEIDLDENIICEYNQTHDFYQAVHNDTNKYDDSIIIEDDLFDESGEMTLFDDYILSKVKFDEIRELVNGNISGNI